MSAAILEFVTENGLRFSPATPGSENAYKVVHDACVRYARAAQGSICGDGDAVQLDASARGVQPAAEAIAAGPTPTPFRFHAASAGSAVATVATAGRVARQSNAAEDGRAAADV